MLMIFSSSAGSLFQDPVVCSFNESNQCYVAMGQQLHLQMPREDGFDLKTTGIILRYRKTQSSIPTPLLPRWQFVNDNKTMILTSAERNNSGTYTLNIFNVDGSDKGNYTLQVTIEAPVSSVNVSHSCLTPGFVICSADGDNLHFNWTSDFNSLPQLENWTSTVTVDKDHQGNLTCHVENHVSRDHKTVELHPCTVSTTTEGTTMDPTPPSLGTNSTVSHNEINSCNQTLTTSPPNFTINSGFLQLILAILGSICVLLIILSILAIYIFKRTHGSKNKEAASQDGRELYAQVTHLAADTMETRARTSQAQVDSVEYAVVVPRASNKKQKSYEDEMHYGELVFNTPAKNHHPMSKVKG
ncbi:hypothetical protein QTP70_034725 [Hemibagrus guttatus]|uniref:Ig-like domain-containing protein n=1 Tax=Hemibagrus guttatus TaxID=175788 RepID=A0AAE0QHN4_9TELE|nr:hypothetical protein QTP70_034725 [Hemibagrus guttatus]